MPSCYSISLWKLLELQVKNHVDLTLNFSIENVLFGIRNDHSAMIINFIIVLSKYYIYLCKCNDTQPNAQMLLSFITCKDEWSEMVWACVEEGRWACFEKSIGV